GRPYRRGIARDITEPRRAEGALRESSLFNQQIIRNAREGVVVYGCDHRYKVWNPYMEHLTGVPASQVLAWIYHDCVEQRSGESVRRLDITQPNENATRRFFCDRL